MRLDLLFYGVSLLFAAGTAIFSEFYGYRVWGNFASAGYLLALVLVLLSRTRAGAASRLVRSRWTPVAVSGLLACLAPLFVLVFRRSPSFVWGDWPWSFPAQPEVWVVERSARLLLEHGTPYTDLSGLGRAAHPDDYTPYGPVMTVFGLPRALFGDHALTDARIWFLVGAVLVAALAWRVMGRPTVPVLAAQLAAVSPLTLLTFTVAGDDLPVIALVVLGAALAYRANPAWAGVACAVMVCTKLTALPAAGVLLIAIFACRGWRAMLIFLGTVVASTAVLAIPVLAVDPTSFVEHVIMYPAGLGEAGSPAASPLPGHLIAQLGPVGHGVSLALLAAAACALVAWLVIRPPRDPADVLLRTAVGLGTAIILAPATRWGYLVYPLALAGAMLCYSAAAEEGTARTRTPAGPNVAGTPTDDADRPIASPDTRGIQA